MAHNLLTESLIRFETTEGQQTGSLPDVYAALMADRVESFPALRAHQEPAWHLFLAQLGAIACHRAGLDAPPDDDAAWQDIIGCLTRAEFPNDEPWSLVVEDWSKPAFLQPPVPEGVTLKDDAVLAPDALDMLITSRNHDLKQEVAQAAYDDDWMFALVSLQTMEGYGGPKNYGIARMNGGSSSRVLLSLAPMSQTVGEPSVRYGRRLKRDLTQLLRRRESILEQTAIPYRETYGIALTWAVPWPEGEQLALEDLDIWFIEVCRRVRLEDSASRLFAKVGNSSAERVRAKHLNGNIADPWAPVHPVESKALSITERGNFHYRRIVELTLSGEWQLPPLAELGADELDTTPNWLLAFAAIARGNTVTGGFKSRTIPLDGRTARRLGAQRRELHQLATEQISEIKKIDDALAGAIGVFGRSGVYWRDVPKDRRKKEGERQRKRAQPYRDRLDVVADRAFFRALWARFEAQDQGSSEAVEDARRAFLLPLIDATRDLLEEGLADIPCPSIHRPRAEARARRWFEAQIRSDRETKAGGSVGFPGLFDKRNDTEVAHAA
ncbi:MULTISPECIES: hypothetical protein [Filomicrobium]|nr:MULTISPECIES: hypothetical protein [Filomicrobium]MCV0371800.1 hypothetical protein [Filomicrobium sp.]